MNSKMSIILIFVLMVSFTGCKVNENNQENEKYNNGRTKIIETEYGYYFNNGLINEKNSGFSVSTQTNMMALAYHDKETGKNILLCNKPECLHEGDDKCVATYKNILVISTEFYDKSIYVYGIENNDTLYSFNLYRVALDGSSIDKIGTVFEDICDTSADLCFYPMCSLNRDNYYFIIHKGYAYLPYYFNIGGHGQFGFKGGGIKKMDIKSGKTEDVYTLEKGNYAFPVNLYAEGDRLYMDFMFESKDYGYRYYDIKTKEILHTEWNKAFCEKNGIELEKLTVRFNVKAENDKYGFVLGLSRIGQEPKDEYEKPEDEDYKINVTAYEKYSLDAKSSFDIDMKLSEAGNNITLFIDEDKLLICGQDKIAVYGIGEKDWGQYLGSFTYESERTRDSKRPVYEQKTNLTMDYHYTDGKLYLVTSEISDVAFYNRLYKYYVCPLEKLLNGECCFELLFTNELSK